MKTRWLAGFVSVALVLSGCASDPSTSAAKAGIRKVRVEPRVDARQGMRYGVDLSSGGLANGLASLIMDGAGQEGITRMSKVMAANRIVVAEMVRDRFEKRVQDHPGLEVTESQPDGDFVVKIVQYGFDTPGLRFSRRCPFVVLSAELRDRKGKLVWRNQNAPMQLTSDGMGGTWEEYEASPEKLRADWAKQIEHMLAKLIPLPK